MNLDAFNKSEALMPNKAQFYTPTAHLLKADECFHFERAK